MLTGTAAEAPLTRAISAGREDMFTDLAGRTGLGALAALISRARVIICNDTGVAHLADALSVPSVTVYSGSNPARWAPKDRELHPILDARTNPVTAHEVVAAARRFLPVEAAVASV